MRYRILADGILSLGPFIAAGQRWNRISERSKHEPWYFFADGTQSCEECEEKNYPVTPLKK